MADSAPLRGMTVLIARSHERGDRLATLIVAAGGQAIVAPLTEQVTVTGPDRRVLDDTMSEALAGGFDWVIVTSVNAVQALLATPGLTDAIADRVVEPARTLQWAAVGPGTARALANAGIAVNLVPRNHSADGLLAEWPALPASGRSRVLLPLGDRARATLERGLATRGFEPVRVTAYRTIPCPAPPSVATAWAAGEFNAVALTSGSVVRELAEQLGVRQDVVAVAIGEPTREAAVNVGQPVGAIARSADDAGLLQALLRVRHLKSSGGIMTRPRRLRTTPALRSLVRETRVHPRDLVLPLFIKEGITEPVEISSMPGVFHHTEDSLADAVRRAAEAGIGGVMLFGVPRRRDAIGSGADDPQGILNVGIRAAVEVAAGRLVVMSDLCLDEFTDHGHCGVLDTHGAVDNDATLERYVSMAIAQAEAGATVLGLSGMMDGQVFAVRAGLDNSTANDGAGFPTTVILAYSAKYASAFYGPFRDAVESTLTGDRRAYQMDPANRREGGRETDLDLLEGADIVMVKPAMSYLDVLADVADQSNVPVAAYQVSGEFSMIEAAAAQGWINRRAAIEESIVSIKRAGADIILTYWATELAEWLA
jgi:porphobilinogen synthase